MDNQNNEKTHPGQEILGAVKIADDVVATIAAIAASEVDGVAAVAGHAASDIAAKIAVKNIGRGVRVEINGKRVHVEMIISVRFGYNIPAVCQKVQHKVGCTIENMTGLTVSDVDLRVVAVNMTARQSAAMPRTV